MAPEQIANLILPVKVLVVGAGGIGCELLKNLVLTGFNNIVVVDLDTIDVSNLNRQFLFRKAHVGKSKAEVAKESALRFRPNANIIAHHDSITNPKYDAAFFKQFAVVMNALDNIAARSHVNRMCLAANVPLVESGTAGYLGYMTIIKKGQTECYECQPRTGQKTYPGCTIRNTPSEPIHCIVWAKHLFNQLFGEDDPDEDVSPDMADPELGGEMTAEAALESMNEKSEVQRKSTRQWAKACGHDAEKIFNKLFSDDIRYLLSMDKLWLKRIAPQPLDWNQLPDAVAGGSNSEDSGSLRDQQVWSIQECANVFKISLANLRNRSLQLPAEDHIVWDKDDNDCMDFVTACANIRSSCFGIPQKSKFTIKSMAGNIIPAIATTNAIIAGLIVLQALKIIDGKAQECSQIFLSKKANPKKLILVPCALVPPKPSCYVCSTKPEVTVTLNTSTTTIKVLEEKVLKGHLHMVAPDVEIDDGKGTIIISSEEGETEGNNEKMLTDLGVRNGTRLKCDDFLQNFEVVVTILHSDKLPDQQLFTVEGEITEPQQKPQTEPSQNGNTSHQEEEVEDDDDLLIIEEGDEQEGKRKLDDQDDNLPATKKQRRNSDIEIL